MYHPQGHNNMLSSKAALPPARHLLLQQGGSIPDESGLVLSTDAKPRLKWTPELHDRFIEAVNQLGGAEKATPKTIMRLMGIPGLTLYHLKSHLQKCRLSKAQAHTGGSKCGKSSIQICNQTVPIRDCKLRHNVEAERPGVSTTSSTDIVQQPNMPIQINEALQMQMEVQRQLQEQLEVQRHLQLRIEAQGKYLQSVLEKAQEALGKQNQLSNECLGNAVPGPEDLPSSNSSLQVDSCLASSEGSQKEPRQSNSLRGLLHCRKPFSSSSILGDTKRTSSLAHGFANPQEGGGGGGIAVAEADTEKLDLNADEDEEEGGGAIERKFDLNGFSGS